MPSRSFSPRVTFFLKTVLQVIYLSLIFLATDFISRHYVPLIPGSVLGMFAVIALLLSGVLKSSWVALGATWLLTEMMLFFIPATISVVQYSKLLRENGLAIMAVIFTSTVCVMVSTAFAVDLTWKFLEKRSRDKEALSQNQEGNTP